MSKLKKTYEEAKTPLYGNWRVHHPNGHLMFYGDDSKANWYLKRNLAVVIGANSIQLTFIPKGLGSALDLYGATPKENKCVVCGDSEGLTRHHIVPYCYRKHFSDEYKSNNFHDVVPVCGLHHKEYEMEASKLKKEIGNNYGMYDLLGGKMAKDKKDKLMVGGAIRCLMERRDVLPVDRIKVMEDLIKNYFELETIPSDLTKLFNAIEIKKRTWKTKRELSKFKIIVEKLDSIQEFVEKWRTHFIETMKPEHLPLGWEIKRDARRLEWILNNNKSA